MSKIEEGTQVEFKNIRNPVQHFQKIETGV
jgi:hypothetical protein